MDGRQIFAAAIAATGGDPDAAEFSPEDLEKVQRALRALDAQIDELLGARTVIDINVGGPLKHNPLKNARRAP